MTDEQMRETWDVVHEWIYLDKQFALLKGDAWFVLAEFKLDRWSIWDVQIPKPLGKAISGLVMERV